MPSELKLTKPQEPSRSVIEDAFRDRDAERIAMYCEDALAFVWLNREMLLKTGFFEECLLWAFIEKPCHWWWPTKYVDTELFAKADRDRMRAVSPVRIPKPDPTVKVTGFGQRFGQRFEVYRGVSGTHLRRRHVSGWGWTFDRETAERYATRFGLDDPGVYKTSIRHEQIYACHANEWGTIDVICRPRTPLRIPMIGEETGPGDSRWYNLRRITGHCGPHTT